MTSEESALRIWDLLAKHSGGLNRRSLCHLGDIGESQVTSGLAWFRELFDEYEAIVRVRIGGEWIYKLPTNEADCREHMGRELRTQITRTRRDYNLAHKIAKAYPNDVNGYAEEQARRRLYDLRHVHERFVGQESLVQ